MKCDRCENERDIVSTREYSDYMGEDHALALCWDCDHDVINGGDPFADPWEILAQREEEEYLYDPVNNPPPRGWGA